MECNFILFLQKEMMAISNFCCCCFENVHCSKFQCVKSVQIRSFLLVRIQFEYGKVRARKNSVFRHFSRSVLYTCKSLSGNNAMYDVDYFINLDFINLGLVTCMVTIRNQCKFLEIFMESYFRER